MPLQYATFVRNAQANAVETAIGTAPILRLFDLSGAAPADCSAALVGTTIVSITCPSDWLNAAASGATTKLGTWSATASNSGTADFFRLFQADGTTCAIQGTVTATGGGGDMTTLNPAIVSGQTVTVDTFTVTRSNA